ncbi:hypothetical protein UFOVP961_112 [uncultured Caudovirales phage]|uniref:Uncharacterized protein n=1 Tax=uncultured Caudovirales phage TaxID=2100421 RepID=A0A6J7XGY2_9CAUD|nr:hypothetical protein UFOVP961_112 [uncultured Caudovirales phage]CAB4185251.1 hypothetical protein UFOVP1123_40 [uncultured Caudovirales phage]CAB4193585.1 hypothetical protein UFOVP1239_110 [uncultured Caudovirales phage]CAB4215929.1 hypothetical protein UFOVP1484_44 [uncultured Caudovirales phage]CAB5230672.1 hypothetical protein UFOVP1577_50 [uncultured Caudovirales phage]
MKIYSLLGFTDYEGSTLLGVFASISDVMQYVKLNKDSWYYNDVGYIESKLGDGIQDVENSIAYYFVLQ